MARWRLSGIGQVGFWWQRTATIIGTLTSANSINVAPILPQAFYYFNAYAQLTDKNTNVVFSVPSGNFGNLLPDFALKWDCQSRFMAANNRNDVVYHHLQTGKFTPRPSVATIANAMDVGTQQFRPVFGALSTQSRPNIGHNAGNNLQQRPNSRNDGTGFSNHRLSYRPARGSWYRALKVQLQPGETVFSSKQPIRPNLSKTVEEIVWNRKSVPMPERLKSFSGGETATHSHQPIPIFGNICPSLINLKPSRWLRVSF